ncbi:hypothetical protein ACFLSA_07260, partial [Bacteroidota bacterium]
MTKASEFSASTWYIATALYETNSTELYKDAILNDNFAANAIVVDSVQIGARLSNNNYIGADIAEFIFYNSDINTAQQTIVHNYLGAKYGIDITTSDLYAYESAHEHDVAGIGRDDASNMHIRAFSSNIIGIGDPSSFDDGDFLLFGHDSVNYTNWTSSELPGSDTNLLRIAREWRFDKTNDVGTVTVFLDTTILPSKSDSFSSYVVWVDGDGDFSSGSTEYSLTFDTNEGLFLVRNVTINDGDFITAGIVRPLVQFKVDSSAVNEPVGTVSILLELNTPSTSDITVDYSITGGTATGSGT